MNIDIAIEMENAMGAGQGEDSQLGAEPLQRNHHPAPRRLASTLANRHNENSVSAAASSAVIGRTSRRGETAGIGKLYSAVSSRKRLSEQASLESVAVDDDAADASKNSRSNDASSARSTMETLEDATLDNPLPPSTSHHWLMKEHYKTDGPDLHTSAIKEQRAHSATQKDLTDRRLYTPITVKRTNRSDAMEVGRSNNQNGQSWMNRPDLVASAVKEPDNAVIRQDSRGMNSAIARRRTTPKTAYADWSDLKEDGSSISRKENEQNGQSRTNRPDAVFSGAKKDQDVTRDASRHRHDSHADWSDALEVDSHSKENEQNGLSLGTDRPNSIASVTAVARNACRSLSPGGARFATTDTVNADRSWTNENHSRRSRKDNEQGYHDYLASLRRCIDKTSHVQAGNSNDTMENESNASANSLTQEINGAHSSGSSYHTPSLPAAAETPIAAEAHRNDTAQQPPPAVIDLNAQVEMEGPAELSGANSNQMPPRSSGSNNNPPSLPVAVETSVPVEACRNNDAQHPAPAIGMGDVVGEQAEGRAVRFEAYLNQVTQWTTEVGNAICNSWERACHTFGHVWRPVAMLLLGCGACFLTRHLTLYDLVLAILGGVRNAVARMVVVLWYFPVFVVMILRSLVALYGHLWSPVVDPVTNREATVAFRLRVPHIILEKSTIVPELVPLRHMVDNDGRLQRNWKSLYFAREMKNQSMMIMADYQVYLTAATVQLYSAIANAEDFAFAPPQLSNKMPKFFLSKTDFKELIEDAVKRNVDLVIDAYPVGSGHFAFGSIILDFPENFKDAAPCSRVYEDIQNVHGVETNGAVQARGISAQHIAGFAVAFGRATSAAIVAFGAGWRGNRVVVTELNRTVGRLESAPANMEAGEGGGSVSTKAAALAVLWAAFGTNGP